MMQSSEKVQVSCMTVITYAGNARSLYIKAIRAACNGQQDEAQHLLGEGKESYNRAHDARLQLFSAENGGLLNMNLLVVHAEDQLMSAENFGILAEELALA